ncbi:FadR family transcriptional regulator [Microaerobacter geothermalis]|uniref:FadR/GntR family transcriptional regulator n=1 Tax=Microaerobacter geothermalis TaxID=674972 RepID=UPI001F360094|nr:FadR/GntR family transcriptional regulator [Microaerobacter geothermalis]MCF6092656.1 FadR family transcriptional regulator [Microaerobacter geothermalis]
MNWEPIKKKKVYEMVIERLKHSIESGLINPGDRLPSERDLAVTLSVSRSAVREALSVMESRGIIEIKSGIGVFLVEDKRDQMVSKIEEIFSKNTNELLELLELRQGIEGQAAYLAALRADKKNVLVIERALSDLEKAVAERKIAAEEDFNFHLAVVNASSNQMMLKTFSLISNAIIEGLKHSRSESLSVPGRSRIVLEEHRAIYEAIKKKDPEQARNAISYHIDQVIKRYC